jgi:2-octaprenyl-6-methoxyphenol hydroxylase
MAGATDIVIRGAGPAGCALALALRESAHQVAIVGQPGTPAAPRAAFRPIALSYASRLILERLGAWESLAPSAIDAVHVSQQGGFGRTRMSAADAGVPALGYVVDYAALLAALRECLPRPVDEHEPPGARCIVHAEGVSIGAGEKRYAQDAVVALVRFSPPARTLAHERFTHEGPLALLPIRGRYALVWSASPARARELSECAAGDFLRALGDAVGASLGTPLEVEGRSVQPLSLRVRRSRVGARAVFIGNAAQTLHPVAGQGLNLALRDAWDLAQLLLRSDDPGDPSMLRRYEASRRMDAAATIGMTDLLAEVFVSRGPVARAARSIALTGLDILPGPRRFFARRMIFGPSALP